MGGRDELRVQRQAPGGVEDHAPRLVAHAVDPRGQLRVVGQRGADADGDRIARGAPAVGDEPAVLAGDPLRVARLGGHLAVEAHGRLEEHPRAPGAGVLAEGLVLLARPRGELAAGEVDLDALVAQDAEAPARGLLGRVVAGDDDAPYAGRWTPSSSRPRPRCRSSSSSRGRRGARTSTGLEIAGAQVIVATGEHEPARVRSALDQLGALDPPVTSVLLEGGPHLAARSSTPARSTSCACSSRRCCSAGARRATRWRARASTRSPTRCAR